MPSDVIWTGLITGGVGLGGILATALTSFGQRRLERERLAGEARRLHEQHREDERRERRAAYQRYRASFNALDSYATGYPPEDDAAFNATLSHHNDSVAAVDLFGTETVCAALNDVRQLNRKVGGAMAPHVQAGDSSSDAFIKSWMGFRDRLVDAESRVVAAMREDVGPLPPVSASE